MRSDPGSGAESADDLVRAREAPPIVSSPRDKPPPLAIGTNPDADRPDDHRSVTAAAAAAIDRLRARPQRRRGRLRDSEVDRLARPDLERLVHHLQRLRGLPLTPSFDTTSDAALRDLAHRLRAGDRQP